MVVCTGRGADGDHCCYVVGGICEFLIDRGGAPRCTIYDAMPTIEWEQAPVGQMFAERWPGFTCRDWPQNIPKVMAKANVTGPFGLCCWGRGNV